MIADFIGTINAPLGFTKGILKFTSLFPDIPSYKKVTKKISLISGFGQATIFIIHVQALGQKFFKNTVYKNSLEVLYTARKGYKLLKWAPVAHFIPLNDTLHTRLGIACSLISIFQSSMELMEGKKKAKPLIKIVNASLGLYLEVFDNKWLKVTKIVIQITVRTFNFIKKFPKNYYNSEDSKTYYYCKIISSVSLLSLTII